MLPWIAQLKRSKKTLTILGVALVIGFFVWTGTPVMVFAQESGSDTFGLQPIQDTTILGSDDIRTIIARIINAALGLLGIIAISLIIYAGYVILTSGGDEEKVTEGKKIIVNAVIGLLIILASYGIVQFVFRLLSEATGSGGGTRTEIRERESFAGSGALGSIIRDHYPFRDQPNVARNTRISVTFREPIDPESLIENTIGSVDADGEPVFGDCVNPADRELNWEADCDQLKGSAVAVYPTSDSSEVVRAAALAVAEGTAGRYFTFVFRPLTPLGSDIENISYTVDLTNDIKKADGTTGAFVSSLDGHYIWQFETGTEFDFTPPRVDSVYPEDSADNVYQNTIVQIHFTEAVDPSTVQGFVGGDAAVFTNIIFGNRSVAGNWTITNEYSTAEFTSSVLCAEHNSCGDEMYCLPPTPPVCPIENPYCEEVLVRTASLVNCPETDQTCLVDNALAGSSSTANGFEARPFTGVTDMAGNALDGAEFNIPNGKPLITDEVAITAIENEADNFFWNFRIIDGVDLRAPSIRTVSPGIDAEHVGSDVRPAIIFSQRMWEQTLGGITMTERGLEETVPFWYRILATVDTSDPGQTRTTALIDHRVFAPNGDDAYYFPEIPSTVKSVTQNCLYPGRGPIGPDACEYVEELSGEPVAGTGANCVPVRRDDADQDTGCVYTNPANPEDLLQPNRPACIEQLNQVSPI